MRLMDWRSMLEAKVKELANRDVDGHGLTHLYRVRDLALKIAKAEGADLEVVEAAALLHDLARGSANHASASARLARKLLREAGFPEGKVEKVVEAIEAHSYSGGREPRSLEAVILRDADLLDAAGAIGVLRAACYGALKGRELLCLEDPFAESRPLDDSRYTLDHFYTKLLKVDELVKTKEARIEAERRVKFLRRFLDELRREVGKA